MRILVAVLAALALAPASQAAAQATATGTGGAAATIDALGTRAAIDALRAGGNAVDAAVAAAGVLGVTEPFSCGIGGGGYLVVRTADGEITTIDGRETAPRTMRPDSFFEGGAALEFDDARYSGLSVGVPGTVRTWSRALRDHGTWSLRRALQAGVRVAREGFPVDETFADQVEENEGFFDDVPSTAALYLDPDGTPRDVATTLRNPDLARAYERIGRHGSKGFYEGPIARAIVAALYLDPDGTPRDVGTTLRNPDLARAYERIGRHGSKGFYEGPIARAIVAAVRRPPVAADADHAWRPGLLTRGDVHDYRSIERPPVVGRFRGLDVVGVGPSSSGGTAVAEVLNILDGLALDAGDRTRALHLLLEAERLAYADRGAFLADPAYADVPLAGLLSPTFAAERRALVDPARAATSPVAPGDPFDDQASPARPAAGVVAARRAGSTTHLVVADAEGTVVSYTFTIESTGGNGVVVPGWGFLLNNELTDFDFGAPGAANEPEGGKRPRSSMSPTIVLRDGAPLLAIGSPGGSTIPPTVLQVLVDHLALGASLPDAIAAPRVAERNRPLATAEPAFLGTPEGAALADPAGYGHRFDPEADDPIGAVTAIRWLDDGRTLAAAEPERRGGGSAAVVAP